MKKLFLILAAFLTFQSLAQAQSLNLSDVITNIPALKQGIAYSIEDSALNYLSTVEVAKWHGFALEAGYAGAADQTNHKIVAVASYQIANLKDLGVNLPILDLVEFNVGYYVGYGRVQFTGDKSNDNEFDHGPSLTILNVKF